MAALARASEWAALLVLNKVGQLALTYMYNMHILSACPPISTRKRTRQTMNLFGTLMVVVHTLRPEGPRIISVRKPDPRERRNYEKGV